MTPSFYEMGIQPSMAEQKHFPLLYYFNQPLSRCSPAVLGQIWTKSRVKERKKINSVYEVMPFNWLSLFRDWYFVVLVSVHVCCYLLSINFWVSNLIFYSIAIFISIFNFNRTHLFVRSFFLIFCWLHYWNRFAFIADGIGYISACDLDQAWNGCRIDNGACTCQFGCKSEFRYQTRKECFDALKVLVVFVFLFSYFFLISNNWNEFLIEFQGRSSDSCGSEPCQNKGNCIQISQSPGYRCRCEGTGFWGNRCQRKCPIGEESFLVNPFPHECIEIWYKSLSPAPVSS